MTMPAASPATAFAIVGRPPAAALVADQLGVTAYASVNELPATTPAILLVERNEDVYVLAEQLRSGRVIAAIAWLLAEAALSQLLNADLPVFVGLPARREIDVALADGYDPEDRVEERSRTARLAEFERIFTKPTTGKAAS